MNKGRDIKRRIRSVKNTMQITRAMEMVSAVKARKAQAEVFKGRSYADISWETLIDAVAQEESREHFLLERNSAGGALVTVIASDRGLCGGFNANLQRDLEKFLQEETANAADFIAVGGRAQEHLRRRGKNIVAAFPGPDNLRHIVDARPIARIIFEAYRQRKYGKVALAFNRFVSTTSSYPVIRQILPLGLEEFSYNKRAKAEPKNSRPLQFIFEPSTKDVLGVLIPRLIEVQIYQAILESRAAEHSSRMISMHNATKNSQELLGDLQFSFNQSRQDSITREIAEISSAAEAMRS